MRALGPGELRVSFRRAPVSAWFIIQAAQSHELEAERRDAVQYPIESCLVQLAGGAWANGLRLDEIGYAPPGENH